MIYILENNESSIDNICNNDIIIIIEDKYYKDNSYFLSYKSRGEKKIPVDIEGGNTYCTLIFPDDISFSELLKIIFFTFGEDKSTLSSKKLIEYAESNLILRDKFNYFRNKIYFSSCLFGGCGICIGKAIKVEIFEKGEKCGLIIDIGLLNSNKELIERIRILLCLDSEKKRINKIIIGGKEIDIKKEKSLLSLGIKDNFNCNIELIQV